MFPTVYGFEWTPGYLIFLGLFFTVLTVVAVTALTALRRVARDFQLRKEEAIRWHTDFEELPERDRRCRHEFTGEFRKRTCEKGFDCRACDTHARLVARAGEATAKRYFHRGHTWVQPEADGTIAVGLDDLGARVFGEPDAVDLPPAGARVEVNGTAWRMRRNGHCVRVLSPVSGEVVAANPRANGWLLKVRPEGGQLDRRHLLGGREADAWMMREFERLQLMLSPMPALADGGMPVADMPAALPEADWDAVWGRMFLNA
jgi:glycine cleavage system H lipoate-binding protein